MKKLFLFVSAVAMALTFNSCSSDESDPTPTPQAGPAQGYISAKFNGVTEVFSNIIVSGPDPSFHVSATKGTSTEQIFMLSFLDGYLGANMINSFTYSENEVSRPFSYATLTTVNSNGVLKGTFSGTMNYYDLQSGQQVEIVVSDGVYDIQY